MGLGKKIIQPARSTDIREGLLSDGVRSDAILVVEV
jgi:hypothetical protein